MKKDKYYERVWLNAEGGGSAFLLVEEDEFIIGDCSRIVTLEFYFYNTSSVKDLDEIEYKLDTLYNSVKEYRKYKLKKIRKLRKGLEDE